ncbi:MAG: SH3 domain-containing protein [Syntrophomonadaceae bacterium]|nr:SH3 domain-containing protein [Syntrophomonadaceae bacterium]
MNNISSLSINQHRFLILLIILSLFIGPGLFTASAATGSGSPRVFLNGNKLDFEVSPIIENSRTMVPLRSIFEAMGADVYWDDTSRVVTASKGAITVILPVDSSTAIVNGNPYYLDVPSKIVNNRTLAPLRFVGEAFGGRVSWNDTTKTIHIDNASVDKPAEVKVNVNRVNIRNGPSTLTAIIDCAGAGEIFEVLAEQDGWFQVSRGGRTGWLAAWLVAAGSEEDTPEPEPQPQERIVVLDAGHGGLDPGACGKILKEKDVNLEITRRVGELLKQQGITAVFTRTDDIFLSLEERSKIANRLNAGLFVSIHNNASELSSVSGIETYFYAPASNPDLFAQRGERAKLANAIQTELVSALLSNNRGVKEKNLSVLRNTLMPSALVEVAFISNPTEEALLQDQDFIDRAASGIANGIIVFMND